MKMDYKDLPESECTDSMDVKRLRLLLSEIIILINDYKSIWSIFAQLNNGSENENES